MKKIGSTLAILFFMFVTIAAHAAVRVTATVDRDQVTVGDEFVFSVSISSEGSPNIDSEPKLPSLVGLNLVNSSSGTESKSSFINGKFTVEQSRSFDYQLAAPRKGVYTIGQASIVIEGKEYKTQPIKVTVSDGGGSGGAGIPPQARRRQQQPDSLGGQMEEMEDMFNQLLQRRMGGKGAAPAVNPNEAFFIQVDVDKPKAYAGEQVTASWWLYTRGQIADIDTLKYPDLKGFWKEELEMATRLNFQQAVVNGVVYQKALLVSYALFPIKSGKAIIDPYKAKCTVMVGGPFGFGRPYPFTKASRPVPIEVLEIPTVGRPAEFTGAVGHFQVSATLEPSGTVPANQPVSLKLRFSGRGNSKLIDLPKLDLPPSIEVYSQKGDAKYSKDGTSSKEFEVLLIPRQPGEFEIPAIKAAYFDPEKAKFEMISTAPIKLSVGPGKPGEVPNLPPMAAKFGSGDTAPADPGASDYPPPMLLMDGHSWHSDAAMKPVWALIFALVFLILAFRSYAVFLRKPKRESLTLAVKKRMRIIQSSIDAGEWRKVGVELTNTIYLILGQIAEQGGANQEFQKLMDAAPPSLRRELTTPLRGLLNQTELLGFAPEVAVAGEKSKASMIALRKEVELVLGKAIVLAEREEG